MTVPEILERVCKQKRMTKSTLYSHFRRLKIRPIGVMQKPQRYPEDTPDKILVYLGFLPRRKSRRAAVKAALTRKEQVAA
jgi:hypothetical protein